MKKTGLFDGGGSAGEKIGAGGHKQIFSRNTGQYGKPVEKFRQNASYEEIISADKEVLTNSEESGTMEAPQATGFNRIKTRHHQRHIAELGFKNEKEYIRAAIDFFNSGEGELYYKESEKNIYKYDDNKRILAICDTNGKIKTFYQPAKNWFKKQLQEGGYIKL